MDDSANNIHHRKRTILGLIAFYSVGVFSLLWLLVRSGAKPSRLAYPCQRTAASFGFNFLASIPSIFGSGILAGHPYHLHGNAIYKSGLLKALGQILKWGLILSPFFLLLIVQQPRIGTRSVISPRDQAAEERRVGLPPSPDPNPTVAIITRDHTPDEAEIAAMVDEAIEGALGSGGLLNLIGTNDTVLIKPNLGCGYRPHETADWQVVKPIVQRARQAGAGEVFIAEGEGCGYGTTVFELSGYTTNITDVTYVDFNDIAAHPVYQVNVSGGLWDEPIAIPQVYFDADVVITVPVLKTHNDAGVTISLKNAFGVPPVPLYSAGATYRVLLHNIYGVRQTIVQINLARKPDLAIVDAILAGEGQGPWAADPIEMDTILASRDLVALDAVGTTIMGIDPERIPYLRYAQYKNLGIMDLEAIQILGTPIADVQRSFARPQEGPYIYRKAAVIEDTPQPMFIDGSLEDWYSVEPIRLIEESSIVTGTANWNGMQDLSVESRFLYDQDVLYAILKVLDNERITDQNPGAGQPQGDRLELYLSMVDPWSRLGSPDYSGADFRLGVGYDPNPVVWDLGRGEMLQAAQVALIDTGDGYVIELGIPFQALNNFTSAENKQIGLDFMVTDVDRGSIGGTKMAWSGGVGLPEDARLMGVSLLGSEREPANQSIPGIYLPLIQSGR